MKKLLLIGVGPHARHFYLKSLEREPFRSSAQVVCAVDLERNRAPAEDILRGPAPQAELIAVPPLKEGKLQARALSQLNDAAERHDVDGVIISTDPLSHKAYALWALEKRFPLLMDKPITTRVNARLDPAQALGIREDYQELLWKLEAQSEPKTPFLICAHRRYHPALQYAWDTVREVSRQTGCPVTNLHGYHCDGQWRLPAEMLTQEHHSYFDGHGKVSHSGYHFLDCAMQFWKAGEAGDCRADTLEVCTSFVTPRGLLHQLPRERYRQHFGEDYLRTCPMKDEELHKAFASFGEIDAETQLTFLSGGVPVALGNISLLHNGFSRRSWLQPGKDLYKGNGRVKHEQHRVHVGPFLSIQIHSCQAKDRHEVQDKHDRELGGNNHCELWIFRNQEMIGGQARERIQLDQLDAGEGLSPDRLAIDQIKEGALCEFLEILNGQREPSDTKSAFISHAAPVRLMSAIYGSAIAREAGKNPLVRYSLREER